MRQIKIGETTFDLDYAVQTKERFRNELRSVITVKVNNTTYEDVKESFVDGFSWSITDDHNSFDHSDYNLIGSILDNLDGSLIIKIGKKYSAEEVLEQTVEEKENNLALLTGQENVSTEDVAVLRADIEQLYVTSTASVDTKISSMSLCPDWVAGKHKVGDIYKTTNEGVRQVWECIQGYDNDTYPDITPTDPSWHTFNKPFHGTTPETALEFVAPTGAHDMYLVGEYMLYTDGAIYKCVKQTNFTPEEQADAWEKVEEE